MSTPDPRLSLKRAQATREGEVHFRNRSIHPVQRRCGICDEPFAPDDETVRVDDERCHRECVEDD